MRMQAIFDEVVKLVPSVPHMKVSGEDDIMSSVTIHGSFDAPETWSNKIFHNSRYFIIMIRPMNGNRYYESTDPNVCVELIAGYKVGKFRKYTGPTNKVVEKIQKWIKDNIVP